MSVFVSLLRGVNVGSHNRVKMEALRALYKSLKLKDAQTYVQSGNVVFRSDERDTPVLAKRIEKGIEREFGFSCPVVLRSAKELKKVVAANPFCRRSDVAPNKLLVVFLYGTPSSEGRDQISQMKTDPEEIRVSGREIYIHFPNGAGRSKVSWVAMEKILKTPGTARNWNSVTNLLEMAVKLSEE